MKRAIILFNLGGPDSLAAVEPFLFNLFSDAAIIRLAQPLRYLVARMISKKRAPITQAIYKQIGNRSPLLELTCAQARALEAVLNAPSAGFPQAGVHSRCFVAMRYWHPFAHEVVAQVRDFQPDEIILLPLYPQFSTTTSASSFDDWQRAAKKAGLEVPTRTIGCYPYQPDFIRAHVEALVTTIATLPADMPYRILFSAHGLPKKIVAQGDPYQWQVEQSVAHVLTELEKRIPHAVADTAICYQSRVGPLEWIGPSTESEIQRAGIDGKALILTPIAFVSEHSETLVELDIEYRHLAASAGVPLYLRVAALGTHPDYIRALASLCHTAAAATANSITSDTKTRLCPTKFTGCRCDVLALRL